MKLAEIINKVFCILCAAIGAFCLGYALSTGQRHVFFMAALYGLLSYLIAWGIRNDRRREEEERKRKLGGE